MFLINPLFCMTQRSRQKFKYLEKEKKFNGKFFIILNKLSVGKNFLTPKGTPLSAFGPNIENLQLVIESESKTAISWFQSNKIIVNPRKYQCVVIPKKRKAILENQFDLIKKR